MKLYSLFIFGTVIFQLSSNNGIFVVAENTTDGLSLGSLAERDHAVAGDVYILSDRVLEIRNFAYDGAAPDAYFWADTSATPTSSGFILLDSTVSNDDGSCGTEPLTSRADGTITYRIEFPEGTSINDILGGSISVWCRSFDANFGEVVIPTTAFTEDTVPTASANSTTCPPLSTTNTTTEDEGKSDTNATCISLGPLAERDHGLSGDVYLLSDRVLEIRNFAYDGAAPDAYFWADTSATPTSDGYILLDSAYGSTEDVAQESAVLTDGSNGTQSLTSFADGTITYRIEFPTGKTINDILGGSISVWCRSFDANFGEVVVPKSFEAGALPTDGSELSCPLMMPTTTNTDGEEQEPKDDSSSSGFAGSQTKRNLLTVVGIASFIATLTF